MNSYLIFMPFFLEHQLAEFSLDDEIAVVSNLATGISKISLTESFLVVLNIAFSYLDQILPTPAKVSEAAAACSKPAMHQCLGPKLSKHIPNPGSDFLA
jgi:hypothetical protein